MSFASRYTPIISLGPIQGILNYAYPEPSEPLLTAWAAAGFAVPPGVTGAWLSAEGAVPFWYSLDGIAHPLNEMLLVPAGRFLVLSSRQQIDQCYIGGGHGGVNVELFTGIAGTTT